MSSISEVPVRTAVVTGASSGIGRATAAALTAADFRVIGTSRDSRSVADPLPGVAYRDLDLASSESIRSFAAAVSDLEVDVLVNNAGESQCGPLEELPADALERLFRLNVLGHIELTQLLLPSMRARGEGRVVFVGSMLASFPLAFRSSYVASKAALKGFATAARLELAPFGFTSPPSNPARSTRACPIVAPSTSPTTRRTGGRSRPPWPPWTPRNRRASPPIASRRPSCEPPPHGDRSPSTRSAAERLWSSPRAACSPAGSSSRSWPVPTA